MKILYVLSETTAVFGYSNGVRMQADLWRKQLIELGHTVEWFSAWDNYDWHSFDIIHVFGYWIGMDDLLAQIHKRTHSKIVCSPIIDTNRPIWKQKLAPLVYSKRLHFASPWGSLKESSKIINLFLARSQYELNYITKALEVPVSKTGVVPLSPRIQIDELSALPKKDDFCLHVSILSGPHKNVFRLIEASIKYGFRLKLAGSTGNETYKKMLYDKIAGHPNIEVLGFVSDEQLRELFYNARVFALPSIFEGVGLVALEAAVCGCDIVLTNRGAPKEYYNGMASLVDPFDIDAIGRAVQTFMRGKTFQPALYEHLHQNYSLSKTTGNLAEFYKSIL